MTVTLEQKFLLWQVLGATGGILTTAKQDGLSLQLDFAYAKIETGHWDVQIKGDLIDKIINALFKPLIVKLVQSELGKLFPGIVQKLLVQANELLLKVCTSRKGVAV